MNNELEDVYGPAAAFSEHQRGDRIRYTQDDATFTGTILWVCAPGRVSENGPELPTRYIVDRDGLATFPDIVWPGDVIVVADSKSL